jgi:ribosomal-protein-alanine N-acetyltransferase
MPELLPYLVEPMTLDDIDRVMEIEQVVFPAPWSARAYHYEITKNDHSTMLVVRPAAPNARPIEHLRRQLGLARPAPLLGYAGFWLLVDEAHICTIAVHPQWQGQGLGELLLVSLLDKSRLLDARRATLEVRVSNNTALELYRKYSFEIISRRKRYYTDNNEDAYIMTTPPFETAGFQTMLDHRLRLLHARLRDRDAGEDPRDHVPGLVQGRESIHPHDQRAG